VEENYKSLLQEEGIIVVQAVINKLFEESLGLRVSSEYGGGHGTAEEEQHSTPQWHEGHTKLIYVVHQTTRTHGGAPIQPRRSTRSSAPPLYTPRYSKHGFIIKTEEEEEKLTRLEKRLVANVDFDDQALQVLGFHMDIYYLLGHLGWVQFSNGVSANTHKELALEILMTMAPILDEGVLSLLFCLEGVEQVVPYEYIRELLGFQKGAPKQVEVQANTLEGFWRMITGEANRQRNNIWNPIIKVLHSSMCTRILGRIKETKITDMELNWLYSALIVGQPIDPSYLMINRWCCKATSGSRDIGSGCYLSMLAIALRP
jgi:hypothetical protein